MFRKFAIAAVLAALSTSAHAAVVDYVTQIPEGSGSAGASSSGILEFEWDVAPFVAYAAFEYDTPFDLSLLSYNDSGIGGTDVRVSGYLLEQTDGLNGALLPGKFLTTDVSGCGSSFFKSISYPSCNYVAAAGYSGFGADQAASPGDKLFGNLPAGFYRLTLVESGSPASGRATFIASAPTVVPLPASLPLFAFALSGFALLRRRAK